MRKGDDNNFIFDLISVSHIVYYCDHLFKVVQEYERAVIFRLGRLVKGGAKVRFI